jgi:hypothetical protein
MPDEVEQEFTLLSESSCGHSWVNGGWEGRTGGETEVTVRCCLFGDIMQYYSRKSNRWRCSEYREFISVGVTTIIQL